MKTFGLVVAIALVATLAGCVAQPAAPTPTQSAQSPTPTPTTGLAAAPTPRFDIGCDDFYPEDTLGSLFTDTLAPQTPAQYSATDPGLDDSALARQDGGLHCGWSNGKPVVDSSGQDGAGQAVSLTVYPDAADRWKFEAKYGGITTDNQQYCSPGATISCYLNAFADGYVVHTVLDHVRGKGGKPDANGLLATPAAVRAVFAHVTSLLASAGTPAPAWHPAAPADSSPSKCGSYLTGMQVQEALGLSTRIELEGPDGGVPFSKDASFFGCGFMTAASDNGYGRISWMHEGAASLARAIRERTTPALTPLEVDGLTGDDTASIGRAADKTLYVDLGIGGNWIELRLWPVTADLAQPTNTDTEYAKALANAIVANLAA